ncbi:MAG: intradiol ring-cleavage dioxygenase [Actinomycetales bacterium]
MPSRPRGLSRPDEHIAETQPDNEAYVRSVHDRGLAFDLATLSRRQMLSLAGGAGIAGLLGLRTSDALAACGLTEVDTETEGPYPADGSNGPNVRVQDGIVRQDIRSSFGSGTGTAAGVPLTINLTVQDLECVALAGVAVYLWHCDRDGNYSLYSAGITGENYLRGIQQADSNGLVSFTSIFPGCYSGRWPHIHFEVYSSLAEATATSSTIVKTSQLALPEAAAREVYATTGYSSSITNLNRITLATDNVFSNNSASGQIAEVTGDTTNGYTASLTIAVDGESSAVAGREYRFPTPHGRRPGA